jgi:hypothetical protein
MPRLSQLMIRTALVWLALGTTLGGLVLFNKGVPLLPWLWTLRAAHIHILLVGWTVQLACGVAFWILPRLDAGGSRGNERLVWLCYGSLNAAVTLAAIYEPGAASAGMAAGELVYIVVGALYLIAAAAMFIHAWPRVVSFRTLPRPGATAPDQGD